MRNLVRPGSLLAGFFAGAVLATAATAFAEERHDLVKIIESVLLNVNVTGGQVSVTASTPLPVAVAAHTPFRTLTSVGPGETTLTTNTSNQLLVIDAVSATPVNATAFVATIHSGSAAYENYFAFPTNIALYQLTKLYLLPGDSLSTRSDGSGVLYSLSGHYE